MKHLNDKTFDHAILGARPVLVDFVAAWCPPCDAMKPVLAALASDRDDVELVTVDVEESPAVAGRYGIRAMPTLLLLLGGQPKAQLVGARPRASVDRWLSDALRS